MHIGLPHLNRFLRTTLRRLALLRLLESIGIGLLIGSAPALARGGWLVWTGAPALLAVLICLAAGAMLGLLYGFYRRPSMFETSLVADRQLLTGELFSSAYLIATAATWTPWTQTLAAIAEARATTVTARALSLGRLSARAWGGIAIAVALTLLLAAVGERHRQTPAALADALQTSALPGDRAEAWNQAAAVTIQPILPPDPDDLQASRLGSDAAATAVPPTQPTPPASPDDPDATAPRDAPASDQGAGSGASRTRPPGSSPPGLSPPGLSPPRPDVAPAERALRTGAAVHESSGDGAGAGTDPSPAIDPSARGGAARSAADNRSAAPPPWNSADWPNRVHAASEALESGRVPAPYRDLVRLYFSPESRS